MASLTPTAIASGDLTDLVSSSSTTTITIYPSDDNILSVLQGRHRADLPYAQIGATNLVVVNPFKAVQSLGEGSRRDYEERSYRSGGKGKEPETEDQGPTKALQPHVFDMAARLMMMMKRVGGRQIIVLSGQSGSGKSTTLSLLTSQILRLSNPSNRRLSTPNPTLAKLPSQLPSILTILSSFGSSKTPINSQASSHSLLLELHFGSTAASGAGRLTGMKVLAWGLDKSRVNTSALTHDSRTFHVFYQLLAGATTAERDGLQLEDLSDYALLASSGTFRLPGSSASGTQSGLGGVATDDAMGLSDLRMAFKNMGFKTKTVHGIFTILTCILLLSNVQFTSPDQHTEGADVSPESMPALDSLARLLVVQADDLREGLTMRTVYAKKGKEVYTVLLDARQASEQRDGLMRDLYAILFAFVVESLNQRVCPSTPSADHNPNIVSILDIPGYQSRSPPPSSLSGSQGPLVPSIHGPNRLPEFMTNYQDEVLQLFILKNAFEPHHSLAASGTSSGPEGFRPKVELLANDVCVEMLRGSSALPTIVQPWKKPGGLLGMFGKAAGNVQKGKNPRGRKSTSSASAEGEEKDESLVLFEEIVEKYGNSKVIKASPPKNPSGATSPNPFDSVTSFALPQRRTPPLNFTVNHYTVPTTYEMNSFTRDNSDLLDPLLLATLRSSEDGFIRKLVSGPGIATEEGAASQLSGNSSGVVRAQVGSWSLRVPAGIPSTDSPSTGGDTAEGSADALGTLDKSHPHPVTSQMDFTLSSVLSSFEQIKHKTIWTILHIKPNNSASPNSFDKRLVKRQLGEMRVGDWIKRFSVEFPVALTLKSFAEKYGGQDGGFGSGGFGVGDGDGFGIMDSLRFKEKVDTVVRREGWVEGRDHVLMSDSGGVEMIFLTWSVWRSLDAPLMRELEAADQGGWQAEEEEDDRTPTTGTGLVPGYGTYDPDEDDNRSWVDYAPPTAGSTANGGSAAGGHLAEPMTPQSPYSPSGKADEEGLYSTLQRGNTLSKAAGETGGAPNIVEEVPTSRTRRVWLWVVWACTWWIPSWCLRKVGRMKRPDVRLAWREKAAIFGLFILLNGIVVFYIIEFGKLLCPNFDKAWSLAELEAHTQSNDFWVAVQGEVYDVSNFIGGQHSDIPNTVSNSQDELSELAGQDLTGYFPVPLILGCQDLVTKPDLALTSKNFTAVIPQAMHVSGTSQTDPNSKLHANDWYTARFLPKMKEFRKGPVVYKTKDLKGQAADPNLQRIWGVYEGDVYDLTDYFNTQSTFQNDDDYKFLDSGIEETFKERAGQDLTGPLNQVFTTMDPKVRAQNINCMKNVFFVGQSDFRDTPRCQVQNYFLIVASAIIMASMALKFLAALQLSPKRTPELQDKFVICQVPCYTEGEDSLRRTIDSLAGLNYDDKRKLIFIICDGNIIGSGNDRTTPQIVLSILGIDPQLDPEPLLFKSVGEGSRALNYGKVYSGLYEFEGHVVPYMVIVKVGKPTERSKPGNRGKRDSQILLMHYLNRVHFDAPMSPLELEIYHQMRNVIGIDPAFYEYIFTVDADTMVTPESLNRLVASAADDSSIIGICGETKLHNEEGSWWTMIQVYEYYISHNLSKAFESLFGSVTCLPGCFSLYRIRTADKGRPIIISNRIIDEYAEPNVDTLHKKNLFSLGEDRYLTTLLLKHFPTFKTKFCSDAICRTVAPESWRILFSQRRRWINSTVHNLCELAFLPELFGFCCFSMRFFVFIDLLGTLILPSTVVYLIYLIVTVAIGGTAIPVIALIMLGLVYGLQAIIFILKREFMLVGWMVVYILSYPVYSFFLPVYSFWCMDEFGWGNTRLVIGEGKDKKVIVPDDDKFDDSMIPLKKFSEYEAEAWETQSRYSADTGYESKPRSRSRGPGSANRSNQGSPSPYQQASQAGDYYRDTNLTNPALNSKPSLSNLSQHSGHVPPMSQYGMGMPPQLPFMPMGGGPGSFAGSDYGGIPMMPTPMGYQNTGSVYGMGMMAPRNTMAPNFTGGGWGGSQAGSATGPMSGPLPPIGGVGARPMSSFSMATTMNPFMGPSQNANPSDDELYNALKHYLSTQDLMTVTKKTAREAIAAQFPKADLTSRKDFLNKSIDSILSES